MFDVAVATSAHVLYVTDKQARYLLKHTVKLSIKLSLPNDLNIPVVGI